MTAGAVMTFLISVTDKVSSDMEAYSEGRWISP